MQPPGGSERKQTAAAAVASKGGPAAGSVEDDFLSSARLGKFLSTFVVMIYSLTVLQGYVIERLVASGLTAVC